MEALVSIIIPVYNSEKYLGDTIRSAIEQTYTDKEIIIVDDGSTDNSLNIAGSFGSDTVRVFSQENKGASAARNLGLNHAQGIYIQFLDADDLLSPDKIAAQVKMLAGKANVMAVCSTVHFKEGEDYQLSKPSEYEERFLYSTDDPVGFMINLWGGNDFNASMIQPNAWLTPIALIDQFGNWDEQITLDDDGEFFSRMALNSKGIIKTGGLNYYRKYPVSTTNLASQKTKAGLESWYNSVMLKKKYLFEKNDTAAAKKAIFKLFTELSTICYLTAPGIYYNIQKELKKLPRYKCKVVLGGRALNIISSIFGWRIAKRIQHLYYSNKK